MSRPVDIDDRDELLNRQVHPRQHDPAKGGALRVAFTPSKEHAGLLSTLRARVGAQEAYLRHTSAGYESLGTWPVEVGHACDLELRCLDDGGVDGAPADHASVDFNPIAERARQRQAARKLAEAANERGPLFQPE